MTRNSINIFSKILWLHRCVFYNFYRWQKLYFFNPTPEFGAVAMSFGWIAANLLNTALFVKIILNVNLIPIGMNRLIVIFFSGIALILNYTYLVANGRFQKIQEEFESQSENEKTFGKRLTLFYFYFTLLLLVAFTYILW